MQNFVYRTQHMRIILYDPIRKKPYNHKKLQIALTFDIGSKYKL